MNSKQRRRDRRRWPYEITVLHKDYDEYVEAWNWLKDRYTKKAYKCGWRDRHIDIGIVDYEDDSFRVVWEFQKQRDAVAFALAWAGD